MQTLTIELLNIKAIDLLRDLGALELIRLIKPDKLPSVGVRLGSLDGQYSIHDDLNEPLDDLKDYQ